MILSFVESKLTSKYKTTMSTGELLNVEPLELKFPFELKKQISCSIQLSNKTENHVAFKVKTTNPKENCVRSNTGVVLPRSTCDVIVTMEAQKEAPGDMQCKDKFLLQSVVASPGATTKDIAPEMFSKEAGHAVELLRHGDKKSQVSGFSLVFVILVGLIGVVLGYIMKK